MQERSDRVLDWHTDTRLVHEGAIRSEFSETSETLYLT